MSQWIVVHQQRIEQHNVLLQEHQALQASVVNLEQAHQQEVAREQALEAEENNAKAQFQEVQASVAQQGAAHQTELAALQAKEAELAQLQAQVTQMQESVTQLEQLHQQELAREQQLEAEVNNCVAQHQAIQVAVAEQFALHQAELQKEQQLAAEINVLSQEIQQDEARYAEYQNEMNWMHNHLGEICSFRNAHGRLMTALPDGHINWDREQINEWERFFVVREGPHFAFRSCHNHYLSVKGDGNWRCDEPFPGPCEKFEMIRVQGSVRRHLRAFL